MLDTAHIHKRRDRPSGPEQKVSRRSFRSLGIEMSNSASDLDAPAVSVRCELPEATAALTIMLATYGDACASPTPDDYVGSIKKKSPAAGPGGSRKAAIV